jgi:ASC-1-like (ASCH) protein
MDHVAIMNKKLALIDHILSGQKTIETRWYKNKSAPYNKISSEDTIYFKDSGGSVRARAVVAKVQQYSSLTPEKCQQLTNEYGGRGLADFQNLDASSWSIGKNYAVLIFLKNVEKLKPFNIDKTGFGTGCAWITLKNIDTIRMHETRR